MTSFWIFLKHKIFRTGPIISYPLSSNLFLFQYFPIGCGYTISYLSHMVLSTLTPKYPLKSVSFCPTSITTAIGRSSSFLPDKLQYPLFLSLASRCTAQTHLCTAALVNFLKCKCEHVTPLWKILQWFPIVAWYGLSFIMVHVRPFYSACLFHLKL